MRTSKAMVAMLVLSVSGCNRDGTSPSSLAGDLPASYTSLSEADLQTIADSVDWVDGHTRNRCSDLAECADSVPVHIQANADGKWATYANVGTNGTLLARVTNGGRRRTAMYGFRPAPYEYFFLVKSVDSTSARWILLEHQPGHAPDSVASGPFAGCNDSHAPPDSSEADFRNCGAAVAQVTGISVAGFLPRGMFSRLPFRQAIVESPSWISCAYGCCTMASAS